jgi:hypothetical protein
VRVMMKHLAYFLKLNWDTMSLLNERYRAKIIRECLEHASFLDSVR